MKQRRRRTRLCVKVTAEPVLCVKVTAYGENHAQNGRREESDAQNVWGW